MPQKEQPRRILCLVLRGICSIKASGGILPISYPENLFFNEKRTREKKQQEQLNPALFPYQHQCKYRQLSQPLLRSGSPQLSVMHLAYHSLIFQALSLIMLVKCPNVLTNNLPQYNSYLACHFSYILCPNTFSHEDKNLFHLTLLTTPTHEMSPLLSRPERSTSCGLITSPYISTYLLLEKAVAERCTIGSLQNTWRKKAFVFYFSPNWEAFDNMIWMDKTVFQERNIHKSHYFVLIASSSTSQICWDNFLAKCNFGCLHHISRYLHLNPGLDFHSSLWIMCTLGGSKS